MVCILLNTLGLTINWYSQPKNIDNDLDYYNYSFALIFLFEAVAKNVAFGPRLYFRELGNCFDFFTVLASIASTAISIATDANFGSAMTFLRAFRLGTVFKYVKESQQIKILFETLVVTVPALTNIGGLLLLFLYIFSILGVFLFSEVMLQNNMDQHANF